MQNLGFSYRVSPLHSLEWLLNYSRTLDSRGLKKKKSLEANLKLIY